MYDVILDTIIDCLKLLPFLFIAFLLIEYIEHKLTQKTKSKIEKAGNKGPIIGSILGLIPQCGFSVIATNLYVARIITLGTLISIYLATSDEMLPILLAEGSKLSEITLILVIKFTVGFLTGFIIDKLIKTKKEINYSVCNHDHCHCEESIVKGSIKHTLKTLTFILIITFILNTLFHYIGQETISNLLNKNTWYIPFITALIGLIPNCASSILLTELYLNNILSLGSAMAGLLTNSGLALLILFKTNKDIKENLKIVGILYIIGLISGIIINLIY